MNKHLLLSLSSLLLVVSSAFAQQKIKDGTINTGNLSNKDAILELESNNKGFLHTRVSLTRTTDASPLNDHVAGMMVYNTATLNDVVPGIYYNDGTKWVFVRSNNSLLIENQPGKVGIPGIPGTTGGPGAGVAIVINDSGTWVFNPATNSWTNINGTKGADGKDGLDGKSISTGNATPSGGKNGDTYVNVTTGAVYTNANGTWELTGNIKGSNGKDGLDGKSTSGAAGVPGAGTGANGDTYINTITGDVYTNNNGIWTVTGNIKGKDGINGLDGKSLTSGTGTPTGGGNGDTYVNTTTGEVYTNVNGVWTVTGNIKGADGKNGLDGKSVNGAAGAPGATTAGNNGDTYVNTTTGETYIKQGDSWVLNGSIQGPAGTNGVDGKSVSITNNTDGTSTITDGNGGTITVKNGTNGTNGVDGKSVSITNNTDGTSTITDGNGGTITVKNGTNGTNGVDGKSVSITNNTDGTSTITDGNGGTITVKNGTNGTNGIDGKSVSITNNTDGTSTITDGNGGTIIVKNGVDGATGPAGPSTPQTITHTLNSAGNLLTSDVNGIAPATKIINTNVLGLDATNKLKSTVNGIASNEVDLSALATSSDNGLTKTGNNIQLGGALSKGTTITTTATNTLAIAGLQNSSTPTSDVAIVAGAGGVLKTVSTASLAIEPWNVQNTTVKATLNTDNIYQNGSVGIGLPSGASIPSFTVGSITVTPKLHVEGDIAATGKIYTTNSVYADYVFDYYFNGFSKIYDKYKFKSLAEVAEFIKANKHLPGVTPIKDLLKTEKGYSVDLTQLSVQQLEKLEELYLHVIEVNSKIIQKDKEIQTLQEKTKALEDRLSRLERLINNK